MYLGQTLNTQYSASPITLHIVSNDLHDVTGDAVVDPARAVLLGPCKTIPHEYRNIKTRNVDVHIPRDKTERAALVDALLAECMTRPLDDQLVAYRGGHRWLQVFEPLAVEAAKEGNPGLRENGVYFITGGMGGIGLVLAEYLAHTVRAKLALVGRSYFPEKALWAQWLSTHDEDDPASAKIRKFMEFEAAGAEVLVLRADVLDPTRMRQVVDQVAKQYGAIHGVIHRRCSRRRHHRT
jgi:hypothetical protein